MEQKKQASAVTLTQAERQLILKLAAMISNEQAPAKVVAVSTKLKDLLVKGVENRQYAFVVRDGKLVDLSKQSFVSYDKFTYEASEKSSRETRKSLKASVDVAQVVKFIDKNSAGEFVIRFKKRQARWFVFEGCVGKSNKFNTVYDLNTKCEIY